MPRWCDGGPPSCRMGVEAGGALGAEGACPSRSSLRGPLVSLGLLADPWEEIAIASCWPPTGEVLLLFGLPDDSGLLRSAARACALAVRRMRIDRFSLFHPSSPSPHTPLLFNPPVHPCSAGRGLRDLTRLATPFSFRSPLEIL
ncbi:uncharacterized protein CEXT_517981 [Caerostris extrusa]|uniref:Uncharacterized protein n=1 Tax=Caerostris extrusa TaxID=172846 RepID=A0AAV4SHH2_CAEEX|nr:uncharacterized protein CEXT_517981 [Caerostris extrusa]